MKLLTALTFAIAFFGLTNWVSADEPKKDDIIAKLVGKWEITKAGDEPLVGGVISFTKDGKFDIVLKVNGEEMKIEGTYKIEKGKLITEANGSSDTDTFKKLTADAIELENTDMKVTVLKRKK